jgi:hypothetical protein
MVDAEQEQQTPGQVEPQDDLLLSPEFQKSVVDEIERY